MSMVPTDWRDSVLRRAFWVIIAGILLVLIRGPAEVIRIGCIGILVLSLPMVGRLQYAAQAPSSFCLPGFRESLRRRCFGRAAVVGLGGALFALNLVPPAHKMAEDGDLIRACLQAAGGFLGGITVALIVGTSRLILPRLDRGIGVLLLFCLLVIAPMFFAIHGLSGRLFDCRNPCMHRAVRFRLASLGRQGLPQAGAPDAH